MPDCDECWRTFAQSVTNAELPEVVKQMEEQFKFGGDTTFDRMLQERFNTLYARQKNARYWAPEILSRWISTTKQKARDELRDAANTLMARAVEAKVSSGVMTAAEAEQFTSVQAPPILASLVAFA